MGRLKPEWRFTERGQECRRKAMQRYRATEHGMRERKETQRNWYHTESGKRTHANAVLRHKYGITIEDKERMYEGQKGLCAICEMQLPPLYRAHTDHDHETKRVRGLLCRRCNTFLGYLESHRERLGKVYSYLRWEE